MKNCCRILLFTISTLLSPCIGVAQNADTLVYEWAEVLPQYTGGVEAMNAFLKAHLHYPQSAIDSGIEGKVWIRFTVSCSGEVLSPKVLKSVHAVLDSVALDMVHSMPRWVPGMNNGNVVSVKVTIPIGFQLTEARAALAYPSCKTGNFSRYVRENVAYPRGALRDSIGRLAIIEITVEKDGRISDASVIKSAHKLLDTEALRLVHGVEWYPAIRKGKAIKDKLRVPIYFSVDMSDVRKGFLIEGEDSTLNNLPSFPGGMAQYPVYLLLNTKTSFVSAASGSTLEIVRLKVLSNGELSEISIIQSMGKEYDQEAFRLIKAMPLWEPAMKNGQPVECYITLPVIFTYEHNPPANTRGREYPNPLNNNRFTNLDGIPERRVILRSPGGGSSINYGR